jgi:pyrrolidone-carboxylate peptidase
VNKKQAQILTVGESLFFHYLIGMMKPQIWIFCFLLWLSSFAQATSILLMGYEPFDGRPNNTSFQVVQIIQKLLQEENGFDVKLCELPVDYATSADIAKSCVSSLAQRPELIVSIGEQPFPMELARTSANIAYHNPNWPDSPWNGGVIDPQQPAKLNFSLPTERLYCSFEKADRLQLKVMNDPGVFVCNYVAFKLSAYLKSSGIPFTFFHVKSLDISETAALRALARKLTGVMVKLVDPAWNPQATAYKKCRKEYEKL